MVTIYAFYSIAKARFEWFVLTIEHFKLIRSKEIVKSDQDVLPEFQSSPWLGPEFIGVKRKADLAEVKMTEFMSGLPLS